MLRLIYRVYITLCICTPIFVTGVSGANEAVDPSSVIRVKDNLLTVKVSNMPLEKVLVEIANQIPVEFEILVSGDEVVIADFSRLPLEKGLKRLFRDYSYTFIKGTEKSNDGEYEIRKIIILSNEGKIRRRKTGSTMISTEERSPVYPSNDSYGEDVEIEEYIEREERGFIVDTLRDMMQDADAEFRLITMEEIVAIGGSEAIPALKDALSDENEEVRKMAEESLRQLEGE